MHIRTMLDEAKAAGKPALTEAEAKQLLKDYGIPVVHEIVAENAEEAVKAAEHVGFPVVLKGLGSRLTHKTERGLVSLFLRTQDEVRCAAQMIRDAAGQELEGFLVQPQITGRREFAAGMFVDPQFGPVVMFGLGGVAAEALDDVVFRTLPLREAEAWMMLDDLRAGRMLASFRGEAAVDRGQVVSILMGLARLAEECPEITEIDINPLVTGADGRLTAVDALVVLGHRPQSGSERPSVSAEEIDSFFSASSIAFVGATNTFGKWGNMLMNHLIAGGYGGNIYPVNPKGGKIAGRQAYAALADVPGPVDLVVVTLPASAVLDLLPQCRDKGISRMLLITSGFSETGKKGKDLENEVIRQARASGILILGPNTMGICNPSQSLYCTGGPFWPKAGSVSLVSQSGNLGVQLLAFAEREGLGIRSFCGSGNEAMISTEDYLERLALEEETRTVLLYMENVRDGRRFLSAVRKTSERKPVVVLKGGRTDAGRRAAASHTGALASNIKIFDSFCRQTGLVVAEQPMDLLDLAAAFSVLPLPRGNRVALMTLGGGWGVVATDLCRESGLEVPHLPWEVIFKVDRILPPFWSRTNPVDLVGELDLETPKKVLEILMEWDGCDAVIHLGNVGRAPYAAKMMEAAAFADPESPIAKLAGEAGPTLAKAEQDFFNHAAALMERYEKPILGVVLVEGERSRMLTETPGFRYGGLAYRTPERAVKALAKMVAYQGWRNLI